MATTEESLKRIEERLTRLEATLAQQLGGAGAAIPGGTISDPAPWVGGGGWVLLPRPMPSPVVDPAPWPGWGGPSWGWHRPWPHPISDPGPFPRPVVDPGPFASPVVDPVPFHPGGVVAQSVRPVATAATLGRVGPIGDPAPIDLSRLSISQLEAALHSINAERARLNSMETLVKQQLDKAKQQQSG